MINKLRKIIFSVPVIAVTGLFALYLVGGFLALPAIVRWQIEQQVPEKLGHQIRISALRFDPLSFQLEADDLILSDPDGSPMVSLKKLLVLFELRSAIDQAWTFTQARIEAPILHLNFDKSGRHNFNTLLDRLSELQSGKDDGPPPPLLLRRIELTDARIEFDDKLLAEPMVARIESLDVEIDNFSTLSGQAALYRVSARTAADETLTASGTLALTPFATSGKLALNGIKMATVSRALSRLVILDSPTGTINFATNFDFTLSPGGEISGGARDLDLEVTGLRIKAPGTEVPLAAVDTFSVKQGRVDLDQREASFAGLRLANGRIAATLNKDGEIDWAKLVRRSETSSPPKAEQKSWRISVASAEIAKIALLVEDLAIGRRVKADSVDLGMAAAVDLSPAGINVDLTKPKLSVTGFQLKNGAESIDLSDASILGDKLSLAQTEGRLRIAGDAARVSVAGLTARLGADQLSLGDAQLQTRSLSASTGGQVPQPTGLTARLQDATLRLSSVDVRAQESSFGFGQVSSAMFGATSLSIVANEGPVDVVADGLRADLKNTVIRNPTDTTELLTLDTATLAGGTLKLSDRAITVNELALANGKVLARLDAQGKLNWLDLAERKTQPVAPATSAVAPNAGSAAQAPGKTAPPPWRVSLKSAKVESLAVGFEDRRESPIPAVGLNAIKARIAGLDTASAQPMEVDFQAQLASGGQIKASGQVRADNGMSNLKIGLAGVALAPLQHYLSQFAELRLASGTVSADGRLTYGDKADTGPGLSYAGGISIDQMLLEEVKPKRPFLAWKSIASNDVLLTLWPNRADIGELRLVRPSGRLIISEDQTVSLTSVLKKRSEGEPGAAAEVQDGAESDTFPVTIGRVRVSGGILEFADLSLRPPFETRMHELQGVITGLGSDPKSRSKLQLDARVDQYGSAKIRGQISVLRPKEFTEIDMAFRNLAMTALSPYVAKFAGYRIASGRLALDLQYRVKSNKLRGENKIVLHQVELGEKVDSPNALDLPLELAIAILKDSDGVIDVGLPVTGDLGDPKFDYGAIIGKAFGNLLGGIVSAPFRALAALFGGGDEKLDTIDFEPGRYELAPPERQKLATVARALKERPTLVLGVPATYDIKKDAAALNSLAVRAEIIGRMGIKLEPGEDPGPIDTANPRAQRAIQEAFSQRYAPEVFDALTHRAVQDRKTEGSASPSATPSPNSLAPFYQGLLDRLIDETPISDQGLAQLATRRGEAVAQEVATAGGIPAARIALGQPREATSSAGNSIALLLELKVAK